jgi:carnitine-CoA ligase
VTGWGRATEATLAPILADRVQQTPEKVLFFVEGREVSYADLDRKSNGFAHRFLELGVQPGDTVATLMLNCEEIIYSWLACAKLGAIHVPMHAEWGEQLIDQIRTANAKVALADFDLAGHLARAGVDVPQLEHIVVRATEDRAAELAAGGKADLHPMEYFLSGDDSAVRSTRQPRWDDLSAILFTGGTTGRSKGVAMSHNYVVSMARAAAAQVGFTSDSVAFQPSPLYHVGATIGAVMCPLVQGGTGATELRFDPTTYWERTRAYGATSVSLRMPMIVMLLAEPVRQDDAANPVRYSTAPQIPKDVRLEFERRFAIRLVHSYANSEAIPMLVGVADDPPPPGRSGKPNPDMEVRLFDDEDREVAQGDVGEFVVRPRKPCIMFSGYYNNPDATVRAWRNLWFHTGDLGRVHADGWWSVVDRKGDELRAGGQVYSTFEIEGSVLRFPGVVEAAVYSLSVPGGTEVKMCLRLSQSELDFDAFVRFCEEKLPLVPRYIEIVDDFPRGAASRVQKYKLRELGLSPRTWDSSTRSFCDREPAGEH